MIQPTFLRLQYHPGRHRTAAYIVVDLGFLDAIGQYHLARMYLDNVFIRQHLQRNIWFAEACPINLLPVHYRFVVCV